MKLEELRQKLGESREYTEAKKKLQLNFALADAILEARMNKGWTQKELAKAIGTKQANISKIESGLANPTLDFISRLTAVLDFNIEFSCEKDIAFEVVSEQNEESLRANFSISAYCVPMSEVKYDQSAKQSTTQGKEAFAW